jgi:hypothetical protein
MSSHITVVNIDGRHGELTAAQLSLAHSARQLPGAQALLLSPQRPKNLLEGIQHVPIQPLGRPLSAKGLSGLVSELK